MKKSRKSLFCISSGLVSIMNTTLQDFLSTADSDVRVLIVSIAEASKALAKAVRNAPLENLTGALESTNVQGEVVQKLDDYSNRVLMDFCTQNGSCAGYLIQQ